MSSTLLEKPQAKTHTRKHKQWAQTGSMGVRVRAGRRTNIALLLMLSAAFASGALAFAVGTPGAARVVVFAHGALGLGVLLLVPWKSVVIRRGLAPHSPTAHKRAGLVLGMLLVLSIAAGALHSAGGYRPVEGFTALTVHVAAAALAVPFLVSHARRRHQRIRRGDLTRRSLLRAGVLGLGALAARESVQVATSALDLPGADRRATGSYEVGSGAPGAMPVTQWFTDAVPASISESSSVMVNLNPVPYPELAGGRDTVRAVLDCTGGWYAEQEWRGVRLDRLLPQVRPEGLSIDVVSATGFRRRFPLRDLDRLWLATHAAGEPLSVGHGGPVRLVAPGRRGFWWVKWVDRVEVTDEPWWLQPPFPLH
jgi:hypothetical protein